MLKNLQVAALLYIITALHGISEIDQQSIRRNWW